MSSPEVEITEADTRLAPNYGRISYSNQLSAKEFDFRGRAQTMRAEFNDLIDTDEPVKPEVLDAKTYKGIIGMEKTEGYRNKTKFTFGYDKDTLEIMGFGMTANDFQEKMDIIHPHHLKMGFISGEHPSNYIVDPLSVTTPEFHSRIAQIIEDVVKTSNLYPFASPPRYKASRSMIRKANRLNRKMEADPDYKSPSEITGDLLEVMRIVKENKAPYHGVWKYLTVRTTEPDETGNSKCMVILTNFVRYIDETNREEYERVVYEIGSALKTIDVDIFVVTEYHVSLEPQYDDPVRTIFDRTNVGGVVDRLSSVSFCVSPFSFFQINNEGARKMYDQIFEMIVNSNSDADQWENTILFDLYCGTGTIGLYLEMKGREEFSKPNFFSKVIGVDCVQSSIDDAGRNARINGADNTEFVVGRCEERIDVLKAALPSDSNNRLQIVVDPSREGMNKKVIKFLARLVMGKFGIQIDNLIYCSCNVHSWISDILRLQKEILKLTDPSDEDKYVKVDRVTTLDMFPHTNHYEVVSRITF